MELISLKNSEKVLKTFRKIFLMLVVVAAVVTFVAILFSACIKPTAGELSNLETNLIH